MMVIVIKILQEPLMLILTHVITFTIKIQVIHLQFTVHILVAILLLDFWTQTVKDYALLGVIILIILPQFAEPAKHMITVIQ